MMLHEGSHVVDGGSRPKASRPSWLRGTDPSANPVRSFWTVEFRFQTKMLSGRCDAQSALTSVAMAVESAAPFDVLAGVSNIAVRSSRSAQRAQRPRR